MPLYAFDGKTPKVSSKSFVHPEAVLIGDVRIEGQCYIAAGVVIRADGGPVVVHDGTSIQDNVVIHVNQDTKVVIEKECIVGHSAVLHDVYIKPRCVVGMGSVLLFGVVCGEGVIVAAGSVVPSDMHIPDGKVVAGNPARVIKSITKEQRESTEHGVKVYRELTEKYQHAMKLIP